MASWFETNIRGSHFPWVASLVVIGISFLAGASGGFIERNNAGAQLDGVRSEVLRTQMQLEDLRLCYANTAYTRDMLDQCLDDLDMSTPYNDAHAAAPNGQVAYVRHNHVCYSPCTVVFPKGTNEDEFGIDYVHGTLKVFIQHTY